MTGEIISVGTEILLGDIVNTNAAFLSRQMAELGISVYHQVVVGDNEKRIVAATKVALDRSDIIIYTGGLGPTTDDITKESIAKALELNLAYNEEIGNKIKEYFVSRNAIMPENNIKQAYIPEQAIILNNVNGTAPGLLIRKNGKTFIVLPGPPNEMKPMFMDYAKKYLEAMTEDVIYSKTLKLIGIGESAAEEKLIEVIKNQDNPTIAPYAKQSEVHIRITAKERNKNKALELVEEKEKEINKIIGEYIYTTNEKELEEIIIDELVKKKLTISIAESCTGGTLSSKIIKMAGASKVYREGVVAYSNEAKEKYLRVKEESLNQFGAVSEKVAIEMATGMKTSGNTDIGIGITGIAGPDGGTEDKKVGLVYIAIDYNNKVFCREYNFIGNREKNIDSTAKSALIFLYEILKKRVD